MLDEIINKHVDKQEVIEDRAEKDIDTALQALSIERLLVEPLIVLTAFVEVIQARLIEDYAPDAVKNGKEFSKIIDKLKKTGEDIEVPITDDPKLNQEEEDERETT